MAHKDEDDRSRLIAEGIGQVDDVDLSEGPLTAKHRKMAANPYAFMRGSAQLFYADLARGAVALPRPLVQKAQLTAIVGDCHMANFGFVTEKGSHGRTIIFGPDDFDDACIGYAAWDMARLITSIHLACDFARGILDKRYETDEIDDLHGLESPDDDDVLAAAQAFVASYRETCLMIVDDPSSRRRALDGFKKHHPLAKFLKKARKRSIGGKNFEKKSSLGKAVSIEGAGLRFRERPGRYQRLDAAMESQVRSAFRPFVDDTILDVVRRRGQGLGSLNMPRYYLLVGPEGASTRSELPMCHIVEVKQQRRAAPIDAFPALDPRNTIASAHLTVDMQRLMQREPDLLLDSVSWNDVQWLVRSRHHARVSVDPEEICLDAGNAGKRLRKYVEACGEALALVHSRGDHRSARFETSISAAIGEGGEALIETALTYGAQVVEDWKRFKSLIAQA